LTRDLRGRNYKQLMDCITPVLVERATNLPGLEGRLTPRSLAKLAIEFDLPVKTTCEFLEYAGILSSGTWERFPKTTKKELRAIVKKDIQETI